MEFKVGDTVKVINPNLDSYGAIGKIVDIDTEWHVPYEVSFGDKKIEEELFYKSDLTLVDDKEIKRLEEAEPRDFIDITFQNGTVSDNGVNGATVADVIDVLVERLEGYYPSSREISLTITHLQEAQNWLYRRIMKQK